MDDMLVQTVVKIDVGPLWLICNPIIAYIYTNNSFRAMVKFVKPIMIVPL